MNSTRSLVILLLLFLSGIFAWAEIQVNNATHLELQPTNWPLATVFPIKPKITVLKPSEIHTYMAIAYCEKENGAFALQRFVLRSKFGVADVEQLYAATKEGFVQQQRLKPTEEEKISICGFPALRYVCTDESGKRRVEIRHVYLEVDDRHEEYIFICDQPAEEPVSAEATAFLTQSRRRLGLTF